MTTSTTIKNWIRTLAIITVLLLLLCIGAVVFIDPFFQYHKPVSGFPYIVDNQLSNNAGMAKNFDYDTVLTGSSMVSNFNLASMDEKLGVKSVKLNYNGACPKDISNILEYVYDVHPDVKNIYIGIDVYSYNAGTEDVKYPFPEYLYDRNLVNDISYVLNKDVVTNYIARPLRFPGMKTDFSRVYIMDYEQWQYSKEHVMEYLEIPEAASLSEEEFNERLTFVQDNLNANLIPFIVAHPETEFTIFYPPYSILYWYVKDVDGWKELLLTEYEEIARALLPYDNVKMFCFSGSEEYITDLNNYVDYIHQHERVNEYILDCFKSGECEITFENLGEVVGHIRTLSDEYDYFGEFGLE